MGYPNLRRRYGIAESEPDSTALRTIRQTHFSGASDEDFAEAAAEFENTPSGPSPRESGRPTPASPAAKATEGKAPSSMQGSTGMPMVDMAMRGAESLARGGGYTPGGMAKYAGNIGNRAMGEVGEMVRGIPMLAAGAGHVAFSAGKSLIPGDVGMQGKMDLARAGSAFAEAAPQAGKEMLRSMVESYRNPIGSMLERPVSTSMDLLMGAEGPSVLAGIGARGAAKMGARGAAKAAAGFADRSSLKNMSRAGINAFEERNPFGLGEKMQQGREVGETRRFVAQQKKADAARMAEETTARGDAYKGVRGDTRIDAALRKVPLLQRLTGKTPGFDERAGVRSILEGTASPFGASPDMTRATAFERAQSLAGEAKQVAQGNVTQRTADVRKMQPARIVTGGEGQIAAESAPRIEMSTKGIDRQMRATMRLIKEKAAKGEAVADLENDLSVLSSMRKESNKLKRVETDALRQESQARGQFKTAGKFNKAKAESPPPNILPEYGNIMAGETPSAYGRRRVRFGRDEERAATSARASRLQSEAARKGEVASLVRGEARRGSPGDPRTLSQLIGRTGEKRNVAAAAQRSAEAGVDRLARLETKRAATEGRIPALERLERQGEAIKHLTAPDIDPVYVPSIAPRGENMKKLWLSMQGKPAAIKPGQPGYLKRSSGKRILTGERETDMARIGAKHQTAVITHEGNQQLLENVGQNIGRPVKSMDEVDWDNEVLMTPDLHRKARIEAAIDGGDPISDLGAEAVSNLHKTAPEAVPEGRLFAIPKHVARELEGQLKPLWGGRVMRVLFDKPNDYLRWTALVARPGFYVNNLVGGAGMATLGGARPGDFRDAISPEVRKLLPTSFSGSGFGAVEAPATGVTQSRLRQAANIPHRMNEDVDDFFRHSLGISEVKKRAAKKALMESGERFDKAMSFAEKIDFIGQGEMDQVARHINDFLNDYANQAPWQRHYLRRVLPFQSFLVHMGKVAARLPVQYPGRAKMVQAVASMGDEYRKEQWERSGINPENVASYRATQLPVSGDARKGEKITTLGTQGLNPASGLGFGESEMVDAPTLGGFAANAMRGAGPTGQGIMQLMSGRNGIGQPLTKPGVFRPFGSDKAASEATGEPIARPRPSLVDLVRQSTPLMKLLESAAQPQETYDLTGSDNPFDENYLPPRTDDPRRYGFGEQVGGYFGMPWRDFEKDEVVPKGAASDKAAALKSGREAQARKDRQKAKKESK